MTERKLTRPIQHTFTLESAHRLTKVPPGHKCARIHGHHWRVVVHIVGDDTLDDAGMVVDFDRIKEAFAPIHAVLDHNYFNDVPGLDNPTSENVAEWIFKRLALNMKTNGIYCHLDHVDVHETDHSGASYP